MRLSFEVGGGGVRLKLNVQGQGGGRILDIDGEGEWGVLKIGNFYRHHMCIIPKVIFFSISYFLMYHLYLPYDLFHNESVFITINNFLLLPMVNILTISRAGWKVAA